MTKQISISNFFFLLLFVVSTALGQVIPLQYTEIPIDDKHGDNYQVINLNENGILTILESEEYLKGGQQALIISHYDTALNLQWKTTPLIKYDHKIKMYYQEAERLYLLIEKKLTAYDVIEVNLVNGDCRFFKIEDIIPLEVSFFKVFNKVIFMAGEVENRPAVLWFDYQNSKTPRVLPQINTLKATVQSIAASLDNETISVVLTSVSMGKSSIYIQNYSLDGHLLDKIEIPPSKEYSFLTFRQYVYNDQHQLLIGTYGNRGNSLAQGFYVMNIEEMEQKNIRFYDFSQLKNFFNYLSDRQKEKLLEKVAKKQEQGKVYTLDINLLLSELVVTQDKLLLFAESYKANTVQSQNLYANNAAMQNLAMNRWSSRPAWNLPASSNSGTATMYNYKNALVVAFDKKGNLLWDNALEYEDRENMQLQSQTFFTIEQDSINMLCVDNEDLYYKQTSKNITVTDLEKSSIDTFFRDVKPINELKPAVMAWHNQTFLAYGSQTIKTVSAEKGVAIKEVFYLAKFYCRRKPKVAKGIEK